MDDEGFVSRHHKVAPADGVVAPADGGDEAMAQATVVGGGDDGEGEDEIGRGFVMVIDDQKKAPLVSKKQRKSGMHIYV